jgi:hypothetical protein
MPRLGRRLLLESGVFINALLILKVFKVLRLVK